MQAAARRGDATWGFCDDDHKCCPHGRNGEITSGSADVFINGAAAYRLGDQGTCNCPHDGKFQALSGSTTVFINNRQAVRRSDCTMCVKCGECGVISGGSENVMVGE